MPGFGDRQGEGSEAALAKAALWRGDCLFGQMLRDLRPGLGWLAAQAWAAPDRIAALGLSMGAAHACWLGALDLRIGAVAQLCMLADIGPLIETGAHDRHGIYLVVPGLLQLAEMGDIAGLVAPRPQFIGPWRRGRAGPACGAPCGAAPGARGLCRGRGAARMLPGAGHRASGNAGHAAGDTGVSRPLGGSRAKERDDEAAVDHRRGRKARRGDALPPRPSRPILRLSDLIDMDDAGAERRAGPLRSRRRRGGRGAGRRLRRHRAFRRRARTSTPGRGSAGPISTAWCMSTRPPASMAATGSSLPARTTS